MLFKNSKTLGKTVTLTTWALVTLLIQIFLYPPSIAYKNITRIIIIEKPLVPQTHTRCVICTQYASSQWKFNKLYYSLFWLFHQYVISFI